MNRNFVAIAVESLQDGDVLLGGVVVSDVRVNADGNIEYRLTKADGRSHIACAHKGTKVAAV